MYHSNKVWKDFRSPYGVSCAPETFQKYMYGILDGVPGSLVYIDDVLIFGKSSEEHNINLDKLLTRISERGLTLNLKKFKFVLRAVRFLGHIISH